MEEQEVGVGGAVPTVTRPPPPLPSCLRGMQKCQLSPRPVALLTQSIHMKEQIKLTDPHIFNDRCYLTRKRFSGSACHELSIAF